MSALDPRGIVGARTKLMEIDPETGGLISDRVLEKIITAYLAASPKGQVEAVAIKPLEWEEVGDAGATMTPLGRYFYTKKLIRGWSWRLEVRGADAWKGASSREKAKAAALADYEARIRSALSPAPSGGWNDMSSAPKDGTRILIATRSHEDGVTVVCWCANVPYPTFMDESGDSYPDAYAWQPLPAAPSQVEG